MSQRSALLRVTGRDDRGAGRQRLAPARPGNPTLNSCDPEGCRACHQSDSRIDQLLLLLAQMVVASAAHDVLP